MRRICLFVILILFTMDNIYSQASQADRKPVAAGRYYPADSETLTKDLSVLFRDCLKPSFGNRARAIIAPHAGYVFSGKIAASAWSAIKPDDKIKNIFLIGSSHVMAFEGASVYFTGDYTTPLGKVPTNLEIANRLRNENQVFNFPVTAHIQEHSLEVQMPFLQQRFPGVPVIPVIIGTGNTEVVREIAGALQPWFTEENLFVISSDFSHYPSYKDASDVDNATSGSILTGNPGTFLQILKLNASRNIGGLVTSMCGWTSGLLLMYLAEKDRNLEFRHIDYCNSGDSGYGAKDEVVGYHAIALVEKTPSRNTKDLGEEISFTEEEKDILFSIVRNSIHTMLYESKKYTAGSQSLPESLKQPFGVFVTLKKDGVLRGCIGRFVSSDPLWKVVAESALSSAFDDPRFTPLTKEEYPDIDIEITVLGPLKKIRNYKEIVLGKHGIYIKKDTRSGTMLPQVAIENNWTVEEFLGYTARDKAGIGWEGWKFAELYVYEGTVLEENR